MGMVIRVLYNNMGWNSACARPGTDNLCQKCFAETNIDIRGPSRDDEVCTGLCWERDICTNYEWGCTPKGRTFGSRAEEGAKVYLVFQQQDQKKYTMWGVTKIEAVNVPPKRKLVEHEIGYDYWLRFAPFEPLPKDKWVKNLTDIDLVDEQWRQGRYRFIDPQKEAELDGRIEGITPQVPNRSLAVPSPIKNEKTFTLAFAPNIHNRLIEISIAEGRQPADIIKEAIAEWLRARGGLSSSDGSL
ncbi:MAG TPA: hypothetical protein PLW42_12350 [Anaerohalosphaeraceae bacterium]|nr:hypothetical protein [Anaerohalosphaeraceae bacterium]